VDVSEGVVLASTATKIPPEAAGQVLVTGSHGGVYVAYLLSRAKVRAGIMNDAGGGKDNAGYGSLAVLQRAGMAAATVANTSARIGDAPDEWARGVISHVNDLAADLGCAVGMSCREAAEHLRQAPPPTGTVPAVEEARASVGTTAGGRRIICMDSVSLVRPEDAGQIVVSGSHGGIVQSQPAAALQVDAWAALFHDAGVGVDRAGLGRLPALDERGIAAATVAGDSARIGDGKSIYADGVLSFVNHIAGVAGGNPGMTARDFIALIGG
jgi:hypothetical protein